MSLIDTGIRSIIQTNKDARNRLRAFAPPPKIIELVPPTVDPSRDLMDFIIAAVANSFELPPTELLAGVPDNVVTSARQMAMGLCVRRAKLSRETVADYFEVEPGAVAEAIAVLDPILFCLAVSAKTPLKRLMPAITRYWREAMPTEHLMPTVGQIQMEVCRVFRISRNEMISHRRTADLVAPRQAAMAICKMLTRKSLPQIGKAFGGRDHTTVLHAVRKYQPLVDYAMAHRTLSASSPVEDWARGIAQSLDDGIPFGNTWYLEKKRKAHYRKAAP